MSEILRLFGYVPRNMREWGPIWDRINKSIEWSGRRGRAKDQRFLPIVNSSNKLSTQSVQPLTAVDAGLDTTIHIAAHDVQFGFGSVPFGSADIVGLAHGTLYYVYANDEHYDGGPVAYLATTNANLVTGNNGNYYVGKVTTPAAAGPPSGGGWGGGGGGGGSQIP